jgi:all-trans-8'-apo-beta-carotenal 15,15'-oxygenase
MLDGDGYGLRFEFTEAGAVRFKSRFVRTDEFKAEEAADAVMYRGTFGTMREGGAIANAFDLAGRYYSS